MGLTSGVTEVSAGNSHTCAVVSGGVQCWGDNSSNGLLGNNSSTQSLVPVQVTGLTFAGNANSHVAKQARIESLSREANILYSHTVCKRRHQLPRAQRHRLLHP